eukprot:Clim_evm222s157 gene=Clim_evmTU222s157
MPPGRPKKKGGRRPAAETKQAKALSEDPENSIVFHYFQVKFKRIDRTGNIGVKGRKRPKYLKHMISALQEHPTLGNSVTYLTIAAPPSVRPIRKYCDLCGLPAKYTEPKSGIQYHHADEYRAILNIPEHIKQELVNIRKEKTVKI